MSISPNAIPPANRKCNVCGSSESGAEKYLLTCCQCQRSYHHNSAGCYTPKILHEELINLAKRSAGKPEIDWTCRWCKKGKAKIRSKAMMDAGSSKLLVRGQETEERKSSGAVRPAVINLLSSDEEESTTIRSEDKGKLPEASAVTDSGRFQSLYSRVDKSADPLQPSVGHEDTKGVSRNEKTAAASPTINDSIADPQNMVMNEEVVVVEPYQSRKQPGSGLAEGTLTAGAPDPMRIYRDRGRSFQSNTPEALSAQPTVVSKFSRSASLVSDANSEVDIAIPSRSISLSSIRSPRDDVEEHSEPEPGVYVFELPGVNAPFKLRLDDAVNRSRQRIRTGDGRYKAEEDEDDLIFKFGKLKEVLDSTSVATSDAKIRLPRKVQAKQLNKFNKALGQRTFAFDAEPWLREQYGRDLQGRLLRTAHIVRHSDHAI